MLKNIVKLADHPSEIIRGLEKAIDDIIAIEPAGHHKPEDVPKPNVPDEKSISQRDLTLPDEIFSDMGDAHDPSVAPPQETVLPGDAQDSVRITSLPGMRFHRNDKVWKAHKGTDLALPVGTPLYSMYNGVVEKVANQPSGAGKYVVINHNGATLSKYFHMSQITVRQGEKVAGGQQIGLSGKTGNVTGPHLHLELWDIDEKGKKSYRPATESEMKNAIGGRSLDWPKGSKRQASIRFPLTKHAINILIEPYDTLIADAVSVIEKAEPGYFSGIKKIIVESGSTPHFGKVQSDQKDVIYISLNKIKSAVGTAGHEKAALLSVIEVLTHERGHLKDDMKGGEGPAEAEASRMVEKVTNKGELGVN